jgi:hypothetical protein
MQKKGRKVAVIANGGLHYGQINSNKLQKKKYIADIRALLRMLATADKAAFINTPAQHFWTDTGCFFDLGCGGRGEPGCLVAPCKNLKTSPRQTQVEIAQLPSLPICDQPDAFHVPFAGKQMDVYKRTCRWNGDTCDLSRAACVPHTPQELARQDSSISNTIVQNMLTNFTQALPAKSSNVAIVPMFSFTAQRWDAHSRPPQYVSSAGALAKVPIDVDCTHPCNSPVSAFYWEPIFDSLVSAFS